MTKSKSKSVYENPTREQMKARKERRVLSVIVDNEFGVLARVIGLFASRGYNIESLTVSEIDHRRSISRITIVTSGLPTVIEQIKALLRRLVPVYDVHDLTTEGPHIEREVALVKVISTDKKRKDAMGVADKFGARVVDSTDNSFIFELSDTPENLEKFMKLLLPLGLAEVCRTGTAAMAKGNEPLEY